VDAAQRPDLGPIVVEPVTANRWDDLVALFGPRGGTRGCWCTVNRHRGPAPTLAQGAQNRALMRRLVESGAEPGVLAYRAGVPIGWCSVGPRSDFARLSTARTLAPVDDRPVWSIVCFYVKGGQRRRGVGRALLGGAVRHAAARGARVVAGYPLDLLSGATSNTGSLRMFLDAGFVEVARRSPGRPIVRLMLDRAEAHAG
jgi:ribosomal protein S18 acetylase RimI-like enzyme